MNIQFMTKENAITVKNIWGENETVYVPNFDELRKNASCKEEIEAINDTEKYIKKSKFFKGFAFEIVYMSYEKALNYDNKTGKQEWVTKWQMMQHPWVRDVYGVHTTKEEMIKDIEEMYK